MNQWNRKALIIDALRIIAWKQYKIDYLTDWKKYKEKWTILEFYQEFKTEWEEHEVHQMTEEKLDEFIKKLNYPYKQLMNIRKQYYKQYFPRVRDNKENLAQKTE